MRKRRSWYLREAVVAICTISILIVCVPVRRDPYAQTFKVVATCVDCYRAEHGAWPYSDKGPAWAVDAAISQASEPEYWTQPGYVAPLLRDPQTGEPRLGWYSYLNPPPGFSSVRPVILLARIERQGAEGATVDAPNGTECQFMVRTTEGQSLSGRLKTGVRKSAEDLVGMPVSAFVSEVGDVQFASVTGPKGSAHGARH